MKSSGLSKIFPDHRDYDFLPNYGATGFDRNDLPPSFSIYDDQPIPDQDREDTRFIPPVRPLPYGCTGEAAAMDSGIQDDKLYRPDFIYDNTLPKIDGTGRDIRAVFKTLIDTGLQDDKGNIGNKRMAYFNVYGAGAIDDFDAARIALWINQDEKRSVWVGSWWYPEFANCPRGVLPTPSFKTKTATLHCYLLTGWKEINNKPYLEALPWQGQRYGFNGKAYISREIYNALMAQPYSGAFTISKVSAGEPLLSLGMKAHWDHVIYSLRNFVLNLFNV